MSQIPQGRRNIALVVAILLGLGVGLLIKNAKAGLLMGLIIGLLITFLAKR